MNPGIMSVRVVSRMAPWVDESGCNKISQMSITEQGEVEARSTRVEARMASWTKRAREREDRLYYDHDEYGAYEKAVLESRIAEWRMEDELAKMQIDAVITDVISEESANPGCEEGSVLVESHSVVDYWVSILGVVS